MGKTQRELAEEVRVHPVAISQIERQVWRPSLAVQERIAQALGVSRWEIFDERGWAVELRRQNIKRRK